jgi:hypothetical protein
MEKVYKLPTISRAQELIDYINTLPFFPADSGRTTKWHDTPIELKSGEGCVPAIPEERLIHNKVPEEAKTNLFAAFPDMEIVTIADEDKKPVVEDPPN